MSCSRNSQIFCISTFLLIISSFVFVSVECKSRPTLTPSSSPPVGESRGERSNVFISMAKSLASEALNQFQESARRNPRLGFNITMLLPQLNMTGDSKNGTAPNLNNLSNILSTTSQLGVIGLKGGILGIKAAIVQSVVVIIFIIFLLTGIAYFACNIGVISCSGIGSSLGGLGGGGGGHGGNLLEQPFANPFSRNGYDYPLKLHRTTSAVYNALDEGQKKFT